ncbi:hypothetical protein LD110_07485 [Arthrobacter sp. M4]|nr:hypothetical protein [Arthrobacter sp. M4]
MDHSILIAALTIATSLTLNIDPIYLALDRALGSRNVLDVCANILMVVGIYFLSKAILGAADPREDMARKDSIGLGILCLVILGLIVAFVQIDATDSSTNFMKDYGDQWAAAVYSAIQFIYIGAVVALTGVVCFRFRGDMARPYFRIGFTLIGIGCVLALVLALSVLGMDIAHLMGDVRTMAALSLVYDASVVGAMTFLCIGLALPPVARRLTGRSDLKRVIELGESLAPVWEKMTEARMETRLPPPAVTDEQVDAANRRLHRMLVEIQDALLMEPATATLLSNRDRETLSRAEDYLASHRGSRIDAIGGSEKARRNLHR